MKSIALLGSLLMTLGAVTIAACSSDPSGGAAPVDGGAIDTGTTPPFDAGTSVDSGAPDADAAAPSCAVTTPFSAIATDLGVAAQSVTFSADELEMLVIDGNDVLQRATRAARSDAFGAFAPVTMPVPATKSAVYLTNDGLHLYLVASVKPGNAPPNPALFLATRASAASPFDTPVQLALAGESTSALRHPHVSADGNKLYFAHYVGGSIHERQIALPNGTLADATNAANVLFAPQPTFVAGGVPTKDGLHLYTSVKDVQPGGGPADGTSTLSLADRAAETGSFGMPAAIASPAHVAGTDDVPQWLSPDQCRLYYLEGTAVKVATRTP